MATSKKSRALQVLQQVQRMAAKKGYQDCIGMADEFYNPFDLRRPSGLISLDLETGGGLPAGGLSQIDGPDGIGKNYLMFQYMRRCQEIYGDRAAIAMACFETLIDRKYARSVGVQIAYSDYEIDSEQTYRRSKGLQPLSKKEINGLRKQLGVFALIRGDHGQVMESIVQLTGSGAYQIIGVDSWDAVLPPKEEQRSLTDRHGVAAAAGLQTNFMNHLHHTMSRKVDGCENETTLIGIRQVRADLKAGPFEIPYKSGGAHALRHGKLVDVTLIPGRAIKAPDKTKVGKFIHWYLSKGKAGCHDGPRGEYAYFYNPPGADFAEDIWGIGVADGVITRKGGEYKACHVRGTKDEVRAAIRTDETLRRALRTRLLEAKDLNIRYQ